MMNCSLLEKACKVFKIKSMNYYFKIFLDSKFFIFGSITEETYIIFK